MQRVLSTVTLLGLLVATAAAFAITERLKLVKSPVFGPHVSKTLSPTCGCSHGKAVIRFKLRRADDVTLRILDSHRRTVRTLAVDRFAPRGPIRFVWDGSTDAGARAPDGVYQPEIHLAQQRWTIPMPNRIVLDTVPPKVVEAKLSRTTISPDGDHAGDSTKLRYTLDSPAHVLVYLGATRLIRSRSHQPSGSVTWVGTVDGKPLAAGRYTLSIGAADLAGNVTPAAERLSLTVYVRYIRLVRSRIVVHRAGTRFAVGVRTDAARYSWTLAGRHGVASGHVLRLGAPKHAGRYALVVAERGHLARATVIVGAAR